MHLTFVFKSGWHIPVILLINGDMIQKYCKDNNKLMMATKYLVMDVTDEESIQNGIKW